MNPNFKWCGNPEELKTLKDEDKLVDLNEWSLVSRQEMEKYTATTFMEKARFYWSSAEDAPRRLWLGRKGVYSTNKPQSPN
ncbi:unnamed protein product, partial [Mesorhabditis belari]|uniref:Uncharacterized protein n=1 Tax=Mesorhabditis belari TaxID=2138241 RepID=A0AAF3EJ28_9BILA